MQEYFWNNTFVETKRKSKQFPSVYCEEKKDCFNEKFNGRLIYDILFRPVNSNKWQSFERIKKVSTRRSF